MLLKQSRVTKVDEFTIPSVYWTGSQNDGSLSEDPIDPYENYDHQHGILGGGAKGRDVS